MSARPPYPMPGMPYHGGLPMPGNMPAPGLGPPIVPKVSTQCPPLHKPLHKPCRSQVCRKRQRRSADRRACLPGGTSEANAACGACQSGSWRNVTLFGGVTVAVRAIACSGGGPGRAGGRGAVGPAGAARAGQRRGHGHRGADPAGQFRHRRRPGRHGRRAALLVGGLAGWGCTPLHVWPVKEVPTAGSLIPSIHVLVDPECADSLPESPACQRRRQCMRLS